MTGGGRTKSFRGTAKKDTSGVIRSEEAADLEAGNSLDQFLLKVIIYQCDRINPGALLYRWRM